MKTMKASEFKAKCLKVMEEVATTGEAVEITKHGTPIARLVPVRRRRETLFGALQETVRIDGDILSPVDVRWSAQS